MKDIHRTSVCRQGSHKLIYKDEREVTENNTKKKFGSDNGEWLVTRKHK